MNQIESNATQCNPIYSNPIQPNGWKWNLFLISKFDCGATFCDAKANKKGTAWHSNLSKFQSWTKCWLDFRVNQWQINQCNNLKCHGFDQFFSRANGLPFCWSSGWLIMNVSCLKWFSNFLDPFFCNRKPTVCFYYFFILFWFIHIFYLSVTQLFCLFCLFCLFLIVSNDSIVLRDIFFVSLRCGIILKEKTK